MTPLERKRKLKTQIDFTNDEEILNKIEKILEEEEIYVLSDEQILRIEETRAEYLKGNF